jgi:hypothetical protein
MVKAVEQPSKNNHAHQAHKRSHAERVRRPRDSSSTALGSRRARCGHKRSRGRPRSESGHAVKNVNESTLQTRVKRHYEVPVVKLISVVVEVPIEEDPMLLESIPLSVSVTALLRQLWGGR